MKKILSSFLPIFFVLFLISPVMATSNLEVSTNSNFSNNTLNFNTGQTVYVRLSAETSGAKNHTLNLRDNQYNLLNSYNLAVNGNQFTASFNAPTSEGYYSIEAKIESEGSLTTAVKTIKVGSPQNANVNVTIHNNVSGQKVMGTNSNTASSQPTAQETDDNRIAYQSSSAPKSDIDESGDISFSAPAQQVQKKSFAYKVKIIFLKIIDIIWPF